MIPFIDPAWIPNMVTYLNVLRGISVLLAIVGILPAAAVFNPGGRIIPKNISLGIAISIIGLFGIAFTSCSINTLQNERPFTTIEGTAWNTSDYQPITSLSDGQAFGMSGHGSFILGCGAITVNGNTVPQYVFYKKLPQGYQLGTIPAEDIIIMEDANYDDARIEWLYQHTLSDKKVFTDNGEAAGGTESVSLIGKFIHVPKGTIRKEWNLDSSLGGAP